MKAIVYCRDDSQVGHDLQVRNYFLQVAPSGWQCDIGVAQNLGNYNYPPFIYLGSFEGIVNYAIQNGYKIFIRSYSNHQNYYYYWDTLFNNGIFAVSSHYSNSRIELDFQPNIAYKRVPLISSVITCGSGLNQNQTSYGIGLEFFDISPDDEIAESWSPPVIAGKIAQLLELYPTANFYDIRALLRQCSSKYPNWDKFDGYGKPNIVSGLEVEPQPPLELTPFQAILSVNHRGYTQTSCQTGQRNYFSYNGWNACEVISPVNKYLIKWKNFLCTGFEGTYVYINDELVYSGTGESFYYTPPKENFEAVIKFKTKANGVFSRDTGYSVMNVYFATIKKGIYFFLNDYKNKIAEIKFENGEIDRFKVYKNNELVGETNQAELTTNLIEDVNFNLKLEFYKGNDFDYTTKNINRFFNVLGQV
jgi:hypothetical protein